VTGTFHENSIGESDEWYTPPEIFDALGLRFDLDPCSPGGQHWVPAYSIYTKDDDGLSLIWHGRVFVNPPFGGRNGHVPWLRRFLDHGNGIAIVRSYTSAGWWHDHMHRAHMICWPRGKTKFIPSPALKLELEKRSPNGRFHNAPGHGVVLVAMGHDCCAALGASGLGMVWDRRPIDAAASGQAAAGASAGGDR